MQFFEVFWSITIAFLFLAYLILLFQIVADIFRDQTLSGVFKAIWIFFLLVTPYISALIYIIVRGAGMSERNAKVASSAQAQTEEYFRRVAGSQSPADQISSAKNLLDSGVINDAEYAQLKAKALA
ncbi:SHOCT domain-containing protein [Arthrobacter sp. Sr24]